ncbi:MAG TPA: Ig domain-containing protein [Candidatus Angelobacter sp.]|nr:Ig domain-containing protein [Candidatus Angelobacter sp.]
MPCEAVAGQPLFFLGGPFQHALAPVLADKFLNVTTVPNPAGSGDPVPAYERFTQDFSGGESCEVHHCYPEAAPCSAWLRPFPENTFAHTPGDSVNFAVARKSGFKAVQARRYWNGRFGYVNKESSNGPDNVQGCGDATQTRWRSYTSAVDDAKYLDLEISASWSQTTYDYSGGGSPTTDTITETLSLTQSIDAQSGLYTFSDLTISPNDDRNHALALYAPALWKWSDIIARMTAEITTGAGTTKVCSGNSITITDESSRVLEQVYWDLVAGTFSRNVYQWSSTGTQLLTTSESVTVTNTSIHYTLTTNEYNTPGSDPDAISNNTVLDVTGTLTTPLTSGTVYEDIKALLGYWNLADDAQYPWRTDIKVSAAPLVSRDELSNSDFIENWFVKDYGVPITDVFGLTLGDDGWTGDCGIILAQDPGTGVTAVAIDLPVTSGEDLTAAGIGAGNPFSHCLPTSYAITGGMLPPGASFDTTTGLVTGTATAAGHYGITVQVTGAAPAATGAVLGAPKPAGYQNFFDFNYLDILGCCYLPPDNPGFQTWSWYQNGWGMDVSTFNTNSGCQLPQNATQWSNYFQSVNKPQGAWLFYNDTGQNYFGADCVSSEGGSGAGDADALWACKYAECLEQWNSQNFARPAGDDKFAFDETQVFCATNVSGSGTGSTWSLTNPITGSAPPDATDFSGIWGGPVVGGFYNITSYSAGTLTLGTKVYDAPSNWTSKSNGDKAFCFGKLRYPSAPSLLGRIAVTPDSTGTIFTFAAPQPTFGMNSTTHQEQIDLWDANMTSLATNVTATRISNTQFSLPTSYLSLAFVTILGAAKWYVNDTNPKGDYALLQWLADFRSAAEYNRLAGIVDCSGTQVPQPTANAGGGPVANPFATFTQTPACLPFAPCAPKVICISPNGENFSNGVTYPFPNSFACDQQYGSKWWAYLQSTMTDLFWQPPHRPCNIESCAKWLMDSGLCADDVPGSCPGDEDYIPGESVPPEYYFPHAPQVEARLSVPCNYGAAQDECAPALPADIQIGWLSPVDFSEGEVALPPLAPGALSDRGEPAGASASWDFHALVCAHGAGCRFNYQLPAC